MPSNWILGAVIVLALISIPLEIYAVRRAAATLRARMPGSAVEVLERRLAAGEISADEYRYERYLLDKGG